MPETGKTAIILAMLLCATFAIISLTSPTAVQGQNSVGNSNNSIISYPFLSKNGYNAIALIDTERQVICIYQYEDTESSDGEFKILAARSYRNDTLLKDYNTAEPRPDNIRKLMLGDSEK